MSATDNVWTTSWTYIYYGESLNYYLNLCLLWRRKELEHLKDRPRIHWKPSKAGSQDGSNYKWTIINCTKTINQSINVSLIFRKREKSMCLNLSLFPHIFPIMPSPSTASNSSVHWSFISLIDPDISPKDRKIRNNLRTMFCLKNLLKITWFNFSKCILVYCWFYLNIFLQYTKKNKYNFWTVKYQQSINKYTVKLLITRNKVDWLMTSKSRLWP